jgi:YVTN family beta-propeller protein
LPIGSWIGGVRPAPSIAPSITPAPFRPAATEVVPFARIALPGRPYTVVSAAGSIWVASGAEVDRIDPVSNRITASIPIGSGRTSIGAGAAGIWVCDYADGTVARLDPVSAKLGPRIAVKNAEFIAVGERDVWVTSSTTAVVTRIDAATNRVVASIEAGYGPSQLAVTADAVWVPNDQFPAVQSQSTAAPRLITRIDPATNAVAATLPGDGFTYAREVIVAAGQVWVMDDGAGKIVRIDPATNTIVREIPLGRHLGGMALLGNAIWVTIQDSLEGALLVRVDLTTSSVTTTLHVAGAAPATSGVTSIATLGTSLWVGAEWAGGNELLRIDVP